MNRVQWERNKNVDLGRHERLRFHVGFGWVPRRRKWGRRE